MTDKRPLNIDPDNVRVTVNYKGLSETFECVKLRPFGVGGQRGWELTESEDRVTAIPFDNVLSITWERAPAERNDAIRADILDDLTYMSLRVTNDDVRSLLIRSRKEIAHLRALHDLSPGEIK